MKHTTFLTVCIIFICLFSSVSTQAASSNSSSSNDNCTPNNCQAICNPGCETGTTCALGTMKQCGVCPSSSCVDNALLGLPKGSNDNGDNSGSSSSSSGGTDGGMIGGIVGGLLGAGLLLAAGLYMLFRHKKQKKSALPFIASRSRLDTPSLVMSSPTPTPIANRALGNSPLSSPTPYSLASLSSYQRQQHHLDQRSQHQQQQQQQQQPRPISAATTVMNEDDDDDRSSLSSVSQRGSAMIAHVTQLQKHQQQQASKSAQAFQVTRVKPQIMRVNTVRVMDQQPDSPRSSGGNLSRSGSVRTVLTRDSSVRSLSRSNTAPSRRPNNHLPSSQQEQQQQHRSTVYSTNSTPESSPTTATAIAAPFATAKRTSAPLLSITNTNAAAASATGAGDPFDDSHSVVEDDPSTTDDSPEKPIPTSLHVDDTSSSRATPIN